MTQKPPDTLPPMAQQSPSAPVKSFSFVAAEYIATMESGWRHRRTGPSIRAMFRNHFQSLMRLPIDSIATRDIAQTLRPLWNSQPLLAERLRRRLSAVFEFAIESDYRTARNPASKTGIRKLLPRQPAHEITHARSAPFADLPRLLQPLAADPCPSAAAFLFAAYTGARGVEVRGLTWGELDLPSATWHLPKQRSKTNRAFRIPLSSPALDILTAARGQGPAPKPAQLVFRRTPLTGQFGPLIFRYVLIRHNLLHAMAPHGLRSSYREYLAHIGAPHDQAETCLNHQTGNAVSRSYLRTDWLPERRILAEKWGSFVTGQDVAQLRVA